MCHDKKKPPRLVSQGGLMRETTREVEIYLLAAIG
jgi:hypothetical protein